MKCFRLVFWFDFHFRFHFLAQQVVVKDMVNNTFEFPCNRWLSESEDDGQISRDLVLAGNDENFVPGAYYDFGNPGRVFNPPFIFSNLMLGERDLRKINIKSPS